MSESESALESEDEEQGLTVVPSSKAKRGARAGVGGGAAAGRSDTCNEAAILRKLEQLRGGVDTESDDAAWLETLDITASEPVELDDAEDGQRELAFYTQALAEGQVARARATHPSPSPSPSPSHSHSHSPSPSPTCMPEAAPARLPPATLRA